MWDKERIPGSWYKDYFICVNTGSKTLCLIVLAVVWHDIHRKNLSNPRDRCIICWGMLLDLCVGDVCGKLHFFGNRRVLVIHSAATGVQYYGETTCEAVKSCCLQFVKIISNWHKPNKIG